MANRPVTRTRRPMSEARRNRLVLQMFNPEMEMLRIQADSYLELSGIQWQALACRELLDLYNEEMEKDRMYQAAKDMGTDEDGLANMPRTCMKTALDLFKAFASANSRLVVVEIQREANRAKIEAAKINTRGNKPINDPFMGLGKTSKDKNWTPGAKA